MKGLRWLITGGTGSLGQEIARQILRDYEPRTVRIYSRGECLQQAMKHEFNSPLLRFLIGDIRDKGRLYRAMHKVDYVVHCAALKHVDICEYNPIEAVRTNIDGTINVINSAIDANVGKVIAISSDKAVNPINIYGATKLSMEKLLQTASVYGDNTKFACVRFGNFIGSRGSVIPALIDGERKGEVSVTDIRMTRWWIKTEEAAKFTLDCLFRMMDGEIYIPKMDEVCLKDIIQQHAPTAKWNVIGRRPGEKLNEVLYSEDEKEYIEERDTYYVIRRNLLEYAGSGL